MRNCTICGKVIAEWAETVMGEGGDRFCLPCATNAGEGGFCAACGRRDGQPSGFGDCDECGN